MPGQPEGDRQWLVEPLAPNQIRIHVDLGEGAQISEEARAALDTFLDEIQVAEVEGYATFPTCPELKACSQFHCTLGKCHPLDKFPCFAEMECAITRLT